MNELVIATQNPGKIAELRALLAEVPVRVLGLEDAGGPFAEPPETGQTFEENAALKARAYAELTGLACLADDSGLEVDALSGQPGVDSAWYAYESEAAAKADAREIRDPRNNAKLLARLEGVPLEDRTARFVCCMAMALPSGSGFQPDIKSGGSGFQPDGFQSGFDPQSTIYSKNTPYQGQFKTHHRDLPHWQCGGATYFVTWRLGSAHLSHEERQIVLDACLHWHNSRYYLYAATIMPDHVHVLFRMIRRADGTWPELPVQLHSIKRYSSSVIQAARGANGPLWQREYFDRIVRNANEFDEKYHYIENNAVRKGLCQKAGEYPFLVRNPVRRDTGSDLELVRLETGPTSESVRLETGPTGAHIIATTRGTFEGRIGIPPRIPSGTHGFGYDPLFLVAPKYDRTSAELAPDEKNAVSHRSTAAHSMAEFIASNIRRSTE
jgi:non-canonical purine NTP pyrophosphatase (RdgB/HAM1 family)